MPSLPNTIFELPFITTMKIEGVTIEANWSAIKNEEGATLVVTDSLGQVLCHLYQILFLSYLLLLHHFLALYLQLLLL